MRAEPKRVLAGAAFAAMLLPLTGPSQQAAANPPLQQATNSTSVSQIEVLPALQLMLCAISKDGMRGGSMGSFSIR